MNLELRAPTELPVRSVVVTLLLPFVLAACVGIGNDTTDTTVPPTTTTTVPPTTTTTVPPTTTTTVPPTTTTTVPPTTTTTLPPITWDYTAPDDQPTVTVLDPGREPLDVFVYSMEVGESATVVMRNRLVIEQSIDGVETVALAADVATESTVAVLAVDGSGITLEATYGASTVEAADPLTVAAMEASYEQLEGVTVYTLLSPRGEILAQSTGKLPPDVADLVGGLSSAIAPLPVEPVGEGAEWEVAATVSTAGISVVQTTQVLLVQIDGRLLTVETDSVQSLGPDGFSIPGVETEAVDFTTSGAGSAVWDLMSPAPLEASSTVDQALNVDLRIGEETATLEQATSLAFDMVRIPDTGTFNLWDVGELRLVGDATRVVSDVRVTPSNSRLQAGAAWLASKQPVAGGFQTTFEFRISGVVQNPGDGFAFVIQNDSPSALGSEASGNGYKGMGNSVAVEFDTTYHDYEVDPVPQHIAVHTLGAADNTAHQRASLGSASTPFDLADGQVHTVTVEYSPGILTVYLDGDEDPVLSVEIDLADTIRLDDGAAWVGFTASTEPGFRENHDILNWTFESRPST